MADIIHEREYLYRLIIGQLLYDGLKAEAYFLANTIGVEMSIVPPTPRLLVAVRNLKRDSDDKKRQILHAQKESLDFSYKIENSLRASTGLDFETDAEDISAQPISNYTSQYVTSHKGPVTCAEFSDDVERLFLKTYEIKNDKNAKGKTEDISPQNHPVIRTLYDHTGPVTALEFHPSDNMLISGGEDNQIFFYDLNKSALKKAFKSIGDVVPIQGLSCHPSGDYLLAAVQHNMIRLYDVNTLSCFVTSSTLDVHKGRVNSVKYDNYGRVYVSASDDGSFKIWDGVSNKCVNTFDGVHEKQAITSARFSVSGKYILSSSVDGASRLWDIRNGQLIQTYHKATRANPTRCPSFFNHTEDFVIYLDGRSTHGCWNSRTGHKVCSASTGVNASIIWSAHSPSEPAMAICCDDNRVRFINFGS